MTILFLFSVDIRLSYKRLVHILFPETKSYIFLRVFSCYSFLGLVFYPVYELFYKLVSLIYSLFIRLFYQ